MKFHNRFEKNVIMYFSNNKRTKSKEFGIIALLKNILEDRQQLFHLIFFWQTI